MGIFLRKHGSAIASVIAVLIAVANSIFTYENSIYVQDRQTKTEVITRAAQASDEFVMAGLGFLGAMRASADLGESKKLIQTLSTKQLLDIELLRQFFPNDKFLAAYAEAVSDMNLATQSVSGPQEVGPFVERFGRVMDVKTALYKDLYKRTGLNI